jgi:hypothetical protein
VVTATMPLKALISSSKLMMLASSMSAAGESTSPREHPRVESPALEEIDPL